MLPALLSAYCKQSHISPRALAKVIGVPYHTFNRFQNGHDISVGSWAKIVVWVLTAKPEDK